MFLMYYGGKLVFASGTLGIDGITRKDLDGAMDHALQEAQKGNFLPEDFSFGTAAGQSIDQVRARNCVPCVPGPRVYI